MDRRFIQLYDAYTHGGITRRDFMERLAGLAGSVAAAHAMPIGMMCCRRRPRCWEDAIQAA